MTFEERRRLILQFDELIRRKHRADSAGYARSLGLARGTFFRLLASLRDELGAPIRYEKVSRCYQYDRSGRIYIGFLELKVDGGDSVAPEASTPAGDMVKQYLQHPGNRQGSPEPRD
jgi:hypothetical protein